MVSVRTASRYLLAVLVTFLVTRTWLEGRSGRAIPARVASRPDGAGRTTLPSPEPRPTEPYIAPNTPRPAIADDLLHASDADEQINIQVYAAANKGVVNIATTASALGMFGDEATSSGSGSGFVIDRQGHILTNFHVVEGADSVQVTLPDGSSRDARVVGTDATSDVAVIQVDAAADALNPLSLGESTNLVVGQKVLAIGNPFGLERTLTTGIISSLDRSIKAKNGRNIKGIIQTDAAINPGNSGGPLLNPRGEVIGMNTAILSQVGQSSGIGFAVPIGSIKRILRPLIEGGRVIRGDLGLTKVLVTTKGLLVVALAKDGPADQAGVRPLQVREFIRGNRIITRPDPESADLIVEVEGKPVRTVDELLAEVEKHAPGSQVVLTIVRAGKTLQVPVTLGES